MSIETAGGASNTAITLPYIEKSAAEALRKELFARKQFAQMKAAGVEIPAGMTTEHAAETLARRFAERYNHNAPCSHRRASHHYSCTSDCTNHSRCG